MLDAPAKGPALVVGHEAPNDLRAWLSGPAREDVLVIQSPVAALGVSDLDGEQLRTAHAVTLPVDGPIRALEIAARCLRKEANDPALVVVPLSPDRSPPSASVLRAVANAGLVPGAELSLVVWADGEWIWWTTDTETMRLPIGVSSPMGRRRSASVLAATRGFDPCTAVGHWLEAVAEGSMPSEPLEWSTAVTAHYVETVSRALRTRRTDRSHGLD